ncbi:hypothetical protein COCC4DRAFT_29062 [Bipolaris maydis ATCC 48331]|uniref:SnoaL-like domain-containing protein n=2 Tax=Cochliobolus heterostrophus TaxID=5016 RepID=M2UKM3_COCH5|nr:uncharacterized protein COCC4DRAFT_29062 [Bipolaris maydis ATCC 48331]EMD88492.1 hypothetical protein COCHEDRAFT_1158460 [Bipolaris maydis C5]KAJ5026334.1 hypothetical protein J3E73DRAFT_191034 [Bipolaris maydis]ENH98628.1 hypothetical protein COCC4DRAFT_29062 [Bipolaris maydis ATCC 48331]KAJ5033268.1 hypothetical protein J3E74DRAFT_434056 [Bipolaris maydis]KAJ5051411.1 hypothetical protein J3E74DRAFT_433181 [Bipolaris maydis]
MKLTNFVTSTLFVLMASQPRGSPNMKPHNISINLDLDNYLINATTTPSKKYYPNANMCSLIAQKNTARAVIDAYNAWDIEAILAYQSPDCEHRVLPASINRAAKSNDEYRTYLNKIMPQYSNFTVTVMEETHDARAHKCIIYASSTAQTKIGLYANEYALILTFTEDGTKVTKFDKFIDSAYSQQFVAALAKEEPIQ